MGITFKRNRLTDPTEVFYPASNGKPMGETQYQVDAIRQFSTFLDDLLEPRADAWVGITQFWYWEEGNPKARISPDTMVVFGVPKEPPRRCFFTWREQGAVPSFICQFASKNTWRKNLGEYLTRFAQLGVKEYFVFDPEYRYLDPPLQAYRLRSGKYASLRRNSDGSFESEALGVRLLAKDHYLRPIDRVTGQIIPSRLERVKEAERRLEEAKRQAEDATAYVEVISQRDAEIARLKALLEKAKRSRNVTATP